jgi:hypothetical protein
MVMLTYYTERTVLRITCVIKTEVDSQLGKWEVTSSALPQLEAPRARLSVTPNHTWVWKSSFLQSVSCFLDLATLQTC